MLGDLLLMERTDICRRSGIRDQHVHADHALAVAAVHGGAGPGDAQLLLGERQVGPGRLHPARLFHRPA